MIIRRRDGLGCTELGVDEREAVLPGKLATRGSYAPDVDLYQRALTQGWPIGTDVQTDTVARLHDVVRYVNDPRSVIKAGKTLVEMRESNLRAVELAARIREQESRGVSYQTKDERREAARDLARRHRSGEEIDLDMVLNDDVMHDVFLAECRRLNREEAADDRNLDS